MAEDAFAWPRSAVGIELFLLSRCRPLLRVVLGVAVIAACAAVAQLSLTVHHHFAALHSTGRVAVLLARGSSAATAWPGWAAALCFAAAVIRLRRGAPEPPAGRAPLESLTLSQMHRGLLREYTVARVALLLVTVVAALDLARAARYALAAGSGDSLAGATLLATVIEALGLLVAALVLMVWALSFRAQLQRLGALR